jgi:two-component sensor histidine kinase
VSAVARAHDQLFGGSDIERMDIGRYIAGVCKDLDESVAKCHVHTDVEEGIEIATDRAISAALIVNELIANAAKYAYQARSAGNVWVKVYRTSGDGFAISVRDEGAGLPTDFRSAPGQGTRHEDRHVVYPTA